VWIADSVFWPLGTWTHGVAVDYYCSSVAVGVHGCAPCSVSAELGRLFPLWNAVIVVSLPVLCPSVFTFVRTKQYYEIIHVSVI
jgi:hypothetical protein